MNTDTMIDSRPASNGAILDDSEWLRHMSALYNCLTRNEIESLIAWEHQQIATTGMMRTADWPGWEQRIGRRPNRDC